MERTGRDGTLVTRGSGEGAALLGGQLGRLGLHKQNPHFWQNRPEVGTHALHRPKNPGLKCGEKWAPVFRYPTDGRGLS